MGSALLTQLNVVIREHVLYTPPGTRPSPLCERVWLRQTRRGSCGPELRNEPTVWSVTLFNPRRACAARVTVVGSVCLCVCLSVKSHLTYGASVRPENAVTYSAGNEGQKICGAVLERELTAPRVQLTVGRGQFPRTRIGIVRDSMQFSMRRGFCTSVLFILVRSAQLRRVRAVPQGQNLWPRRRDKRILLGLFLPPSGKPHSAPYVGDRYTHSRYTTANHLCNVRLRSIVR